MTLQMPLNNGAQVPAGSSPVASAHIITKISNASTFRSSTRCPSAGSALEPGGIAGDWPEFFLSVHSARLGSRRLCGFVRSAPTVGRVNSAKLRDGANLVDDAAELLRRISDWCEVVLKSLPPLESDDVVFMQDIEPFTKFDHPCICSLFGFVLPGKL
jgi:hypothetical protein